MNNPATTPPRERQPLPPDLFFSAVVQKKSVDNPLLRLLKDYLRAKCESHLTPGGAEYIDWQERRSPRWRDGTEYVYISRALEHLSVGGLLIDSRYTDAARGIWKAAIEERLAAGRKDDRPYPYALGWNMPAMAVSFDLLRAAMSKEESDAAGDYLARWADYLIENPMDPEEKKPEWNMGAVSQGGLGTLAVTLHVAGKLDETRFQAAMDVSKKRARLFLGKVVEADGAIYEGPSYGGNSLTAFAMFAHALAQLGDRELADHPAWDLAVRGGIHELIPATGLPNPINDSPTDAAVIKSQHWAAFVAAAHQDGLAQWLWQVNIVRDGTLEMEAPDHTRAPSVTRYLLYYDPSLKPLSPAAAGLPKAAFFRSRNLADFHSGWNQDDAFLSFVCDTSTPGGHRQSDRGHFSFYALGESFAIDMGGARLKTPEGQINWGFRGDAHNLPLINGEMQTYLRDLPVEKARNDGIRAVELQGPLPFIEAEAGGGYARATRFTRRALFLPPEGESSACAVIGDLLTHEIERPVMAWLLHTAESNQVEIDGPRLTITGGHKGNKCLVVIVKPRQGKWAGEWRCEHFVNHPRLHYEWSQLRPLQCLVVLAPYRAGAAPPEIEATAVEEGCILRITRGDRTDTILSALPGQTLTHDRITTDAEFAAVSTTRGAMTAHLARGGTLLRVEK